MTKAGIGMELQDTLLEPGFSGIFHTRTLHFWLNDTIRKCFAILEALQWKLRSAAESGLKGDKAEGTDNHHTLETCATLEAEPSQLSEHYTLWKGTSSVDNNELELFNQDDTIFSTARLTYSGADFNGKESAWYFTRKRETAKPLKSTDNGRQHVSHTLSHC
jgi:hypothetical protein